MFESFHDPVFNQAGQFCPDPKNDEEKEIQEKEDEVFVRGRIQ